MNIKKSPWLDHRNNNIFLDEISFVEDPVPDLYQPNETFVWICKNKAKGLLFKALAEFAPLFPVYSYHNEISTWLSPSPSGVGNAVFIVIGKDRSGKLRAAGGNYFNSNFKGCFIDDRCTDNFWNDYDKCKSQTEKYHLIDDVISFHQKSSNKRDISETEFIADLVCTMPIYLLVLENNNGHMAITPAVVKGCDPADFSYEKLVEIVEVIV